MDNTKFELDLDFNNERSEVLRKKRPTHYDKYQEVITVARKYGLNRNVVHEVMSSVTGDELSQEASDACEALYEKKDWEAFNKCRERYIKRAQRKENKGSFWDKFNWDKVKKGVQSLGETAKSYGATSSGENIGEKVRGANTPPPPNNPDTDVRILGMKPLVFSLVAISVVVAGGIAIAKIGNKASGVKK